MARCPRILLVELWSTGQQHQHHLGTCDDLVITYQSPPQTYCLRICILIKSPGDLLEHLSFEKHCSRTKKDQLEGLPWWHSGWESACRCRGHRFEPWSGKIPHAAEQLSPWATTTEPARLEPVLRNGRGRDSERPAHRNEEWPPLAATRESPRTETKTQHSQK